AAAEGEAAVGRGVQDGRDKERGGVRLDRGGGRAQDGVEGQVGERRGDADRGEDADLPLESARRLERASRGDGDAVVAGHPPEKPLPSAARRIRLYVREISSRFRPRTVRAPWASRDPMATSLWPDASGATSGSSASSPVERSTSI